MLWQLTAGNNMPGFQEVALTNASFAPIFAWFNQRAPKVAPRRKWAMIALRDGLDSNDTVRFPEDKFGEATFENQARLTAIAAAFSERGAREEDPVAAASIGNGAKSFDRDGMNDVGWNVFRGNYGVRLTQLAPTKTSVGWWRVGPLSQWFGRFGRGFEHGSGKDTMGFVVEESMKAATSAQVTVSLRVVWFSNASVAGAQFALQYDAHGGCKTALEVDVGSSGV